MEYKNDKCEFTAFVKAGLDSKEQENIEICIERVTKTVKEDFLNARARLYKDEVKNDAEVMTAFRRLSVICNENVQQCYECPVSKYCNTYIENARKNVNDDSLKMIDLFCGAGGLSLGFTQEGFVTTLANDIQDCCVDTYAHNHPETPRDHIILGNIKDVVNELDELLDGRSADIVIGGPPCQGFSMANRQRLIDDPRNHLYKSYVEAVKKVQPKFFVMENVKGMQSVAEQVKDDFRAIGYSVECHILNAKNFGVPQNRERLIYIGNCLGIDNEKIFNEIFELSEKIPEYNLGDALFGLRKLEASRVKNSTESGSIESGYKIEKNYCTETNDYIYVDYAFHGKNKKVIIDKSNDQILTVQDPIGGITVKNGFHFFWPKWVSTEYLIDYIPADYIIRYKDKIKNEKLSELVELLDEESNPILILSKK